MAPTLASKREHALAWIATGVSILLAVSPGLLALASGYKVDYDAPLAVLTATLIAVVWYTQYTFDSLQNARTQHETERQRARKTLATGVLEELKWLDGILGQIYAHGPYSFYDPLDHPMFEQAIAQSTLFESETVEALAAFHALLRDCRATMNEYRHRSGALQPDQKGEYRRFAQAKAAFAVGAIPPLVTRLLAEGGSFSERRLDGGWHQAGLPPLPGSVFGKRYSD